MVINSYSYLTVKLTLVRIYTCHDITAPFIKKLYDEKLLIHLNFKFLSLRVENFDFLLWSAVFRIFKLIPSLSQVSTSLSRLTSSILKRKWCGDDSMNTRENCKLQVSYVGNVTCLLYKNQVNINLHFKSNSKNIIWFNDRYISKLKFVHE